MGVEISFLAWMGFELSFFQWMVFGIFFLLTIVLMATGGDMLHDNRLRAETKAKEKDNDNSSAE